MSEMMRESPGFLLDGAGRKTKETRKKQQQRTVNKSGRKSSERCNQLPSRFVCLIASVRRTSLSRVQEKQSGVFSSPMQNTSLRRSHLRMVNRFLLTNGPPHFNEQPQVALSLPFSFVSHTCSVPWLHQLPSVLMRYSLLFAYTANSAFCYSKQPDYVLRSSFPFCKFIRIQLVAMGALNKTYCLA